MVVLNYVCAEGGPDKRPTLPARWPTRGCLVATRSVVDLETISGAGRLNLTFIKVSNTNQRSQNALLHCHYERFP